MPSSPSPSTFAPSLSRAHSAQHNPPAFLFPPQPQDQPLQNRHSTSSSFYDFDSPSNPYPPPPPRVRRTFPETQWESPVAQQRPQTWLEPFDNASQFHLFVEATSGLPDGAELLSTQSPQSPPRAMPSLFASAQRDTPPQLPQLGLPMREAGSVSVSVPFDAFPVSYQNPHPPQFPEQSQGQNQGQYQYQNQNQNRNQPSYAPRTQAQLFADELERLGGADDEEGRGGQGRGGEEGTDDELPDYAQSQAEMNELKRREAASRAAELERRWARARGRR